MQQKLKMTLIDEAAKIAAAVFVTSAATAVVALAVPSSSSNSNTSRNRSGCKSSSSTMTEPVPAVVASAVKVAKQDSDVIITQIYLEMQLKCLKKLKS